ncbi:MAG: PIN domain nuclease [Dehalococcoidia bacterium]|nr:PIN domain nuclease [Dehalococcoidia bacterium]
MRDIGWRVTVMVALALLGWRIGVAFRLEPLWLLPGVGAGAVVGAFAGPYVTARPLNRLLNWTAELPTPVLVMGVVGLLIALFVSALLTLPLSLLPGTSGRIAPVIAAIILSYALMTSLVKRSNEIFRLFGLNTESYDSDHIQSMLVDTSVVIDGRIGDVSQTGFMSGRLVIPNFVLQELQHIADSADPLRRRRGRRGLDLLARLQKESPIPIELVEIPLEDGETVDAKLVKVARGWGCPILTTDFNLRQVAEVQGVKVLNLNDLAVALKPVVLPGEEMGLRIVQEGTEPGQGVGFLDDGTMVVVQGGRPYISTQVDVTITRVHQTAMGRMIFAQPSESSGNSRGRE